MMTPKRVLCLILMISILEESQCTSYFVKMRTNASDMFKTKADNLRILQNPIAITPNPLYDNAGNEDQIEDERRTKEISSDQYNQKNSFIETSTFNPDVLNKFLEDYANKIKSTTEKNFKYPFRIVKPPAEPLILDIDDKIESTTMYQQDDRIDRNTNASTTDTLSEALNDTLKRNKYYGTNTYEDRNGWVTLEAIPWSKSKISKWQANPTTQRPWPEIKPTWDKPSMKPWANDFSIRPTYENNKPWYDKPKPNWSDSNEKPWQKPISHPPYHSDNPSNQAQKWPPERPSWNKYDIITDDKPTNFPSSWSRPQNSKPSYQFIDRYADKDQSGDGNHWHDYPSRYEQDRPILVTERPNFSHYQYVNNHPSSHPANGDGQWILLSTNRGYSKTRQRSIKIDRINPEMIKNINITSHGNGKRQNEKTEPLVPVMISRRQVRLTVLPSINGTNTTTSHGGLLEVEKTFKSVEQSRKEYEMERLTTESNMQKKRPIRHTLGGQSSSAILAAVGAGMLPATMAMMIPIMLGRRKRDLRLEGPILNDSSNYEVELRKILLSHKKENTVSRGDT